MNLNEFKKLRLKDKYRYDHVRLWVDTDYEHPEENEVVVKSDMDVKKFDARLFYGLPVYLYSEKYTDTVVGIYEKLKDHTEFVLVALTDFGDDLGWKWTKTQGEQQL